MKRLLMGIVVFGAVVGGGTYYFTRGGGQASGTAAGGGQGRGGQPAGGGQGGFAGGGGFGGGGFGGGFGGFGGQRQPMTVELTSVKRADMSSLITVVGNLVGAVTVDATPKVAGRLESVSVRMGDRVTRGQRLAKIEDLELQQQVKQAQAAFQVSAATIRQREADLRLAQTNLDRSRNLFDRQLIPKQTFDDTDSRYQAAVAQLDLANAQYAQSTARVDELTINLGNTVIASPVSGFVGKRTLDPGAWVTSNTSFISVVDISLVRLVANVVEKDVRRVSQGLTADVEVDAYPGEKFVGRVAHVAPILDPATRTAQIEVDIENPQFRLKPGMYAKVSFTVDKKANTLVIPLASLVDVGGNRGVFMPSDVEQGQVVNFKKIDIGLMDEQTVEVLGGLDEGDRIVTTGAAALREGDRILLNGQGGGADGGGRGAVGQGRQGGQGGVGGQGRGQGGFPGGRSGGGAGQGGQRGPNPVGGV